MGEREGTERIDGSRRNITAMADETLWDYEISLLGGSFCNFEERWNLQKLGETLLFLLLGIDLSYLLLRKTLFVVLKVKVLWPI
jgi:hypothetical protein